MMFSSLLSPVSFCGRPPLFAVGKDCDRALTGIRSEHRGWLPKHRPPDPLESQSPGRSQGDIRAQEICEVLSTDNLYHILGITPSPAIDRLTLRRAYLSRSKACHPDKCPGNPDATHAFQRVSIAYGVLSRPSLKRMYDVRHNGDQHDFLRSYPCEYADETFKGVLLSIVGDFLEGNLEMIRTLLRAISDLNPSLKLSEESINAVLSVLENIRTRVLTCRACIRTLHAELARLLELQYAFRQLSYFDITGRSRLTIQLTRITLYLPVALERAIQDAQRGAAATGGQRSTAADGRNEECDKAALLPKRVVLLIRGIDMVLDRMERILG